MKEYCRDRSRRSVLVATGATMVTLLLPRLASAAPAQVETEINKLYAGKTGKPTDNAFIEAFNGRLRVECLNTHWFLSLADAREKLECWRRGARRQLITWPQKEHGTEGRSLQTIGSNSPIQN